MIQVNIHEAKTHLSYLIEQMLAGEEIIIAKRNQPVAMLVALPEARLQRRLGGAKGIIQYIADDFNEPLEDFREYME